MLENSITITVDGKEINCNPTDTYYQAIARQGIYIPTLCNHPELEPTGACRICVIEVEKARTLLPALWNYCLLLILLIV
jgi:NADH dehydrogenase/NADH:ubiquinone oxidoreductase subunit G